MIDFDSVPLPGTAQTASAPAASPVVEPKVTQHVAVTRIPSQSRGYLLKSPGTWTWEDLRDYVVTSIETTSGTFPRNQRKEASIFKRFHGQYGPVQAEAIARHAFEVCQGWWSNAPVSVNRFCKSSDPFFGDVIIKSL